MFYKNSLWVLDPNGNKFDGIWGYPFIFTLFFAVNQVIAIISSVRSAA